MRYGGGGGGAMMVVIVPPPAGPWDSGRDDTPGKSAGGLAKATHNACAFHACMARCKHAGLATCRRGKSDRQSPPPHVKIPPPPPRHHPSSLSKEDGWAVRKSQPKRHGESIADLLTLDVYSSAADAVYAADDANANESGAVTSPCAKDSEFDDRRPESQARRRRRRSMCHLCR